MHSSNGGESDLSKGVSLFFTLCSYSTFETRPNSKRRTRNSSFRIFNEVSVQFMCKRSQSRIMQAFKNVYFKQRVMCCVFSVTEWGEIQPNLILSVEKSCGCPVSVALIEKQERISSVRSKRQLSISLRWPIYLINSVDKSKILCFYFYVPTDAAPQFL